MAAAIVSVEGNGNLRLYDPIADTFTMTRTAVCANTLRGTASAAADGSFYVIDNQVFNSVLGAQGSIAPSTVGTSRSSRERDTGLRRSHLRQYCDSSPGGNASQYAGPDVCSVQHLYFAAGPSGFFARAGARYQSGADRNQANGSRQWPPRATALELGVNNQTQLLRRGMAMDSSNDVYVLTFSGLSVVSLAPSAGRAPSFQSTGVVNGANHIGSVSPGSVITINGTNLADSATATAAPLPRTLGGVCVTANEVAIPLFSTSPTQIEAQLPSELGTGRFTLTVRSTRLGLASTGVPVQPTATSPGLFSMDVNGQQWAAVHTADLTLVTPDYPADRDEYLILYATGLGPVSPAVPAGMGNPADPVSPTTHPVEVAIGGQPYPVIWAGLAPGFVGVYQITIYVPGDRVQGDDLPVVVTAGGNSSATNNAPVASIH